MRKKKETKTFIQEYFMALGKKSGKKQKAIYGEGYSDEMRRRAKIRYEKRAKSYPQGSTCKRQASMIHL